MKPLEDSDDSDEEEEETFPFRFVGDVQKKGELFGFFNSRYLEIDSEKGLIKRYASSKQYPTTPMETIPIKSLKTLKKVKKLLNIYLDLLLLLILLFLYHLEILEALWIHLLSLFSSFFSFSLSLISSFIFLS